MRDTRSRIDALFDRALELPREERDAFLARECPDDPDVREEVRSLLRAHEGMDTDFLEEPALADPAGARPALRPGAVVGSYRIVRALDAGGAGTVYEAEQARPQRRVALKLMRADTRSPRRRQRFLDEAEFLGRLRHPGVAHIYEAGFFENGFPFIAMEFVEGAPWLEYARGVPIPERLALIARVCDAVHHGHQRGVVHLDLKPGNVLVDAGGRPKVIDFGIARVADRPGRGELAGTLPYMSPEQCDPSATIDVRSDVYSLGVLFFETLGGGLPHDLDGVPFPDAAERIRGGRTRTLASVDRAFAGDLDAIASKALAREREDRYASAAALADDIRRHLTHHPVEARAPGLLYQLGKFARRRRAAFVALSAVVGVSIAAAIVAGAFAVERSRAARDAEFKEYVANIAAAAAALRVEDAGEAEHRLARAPAHLRNWEWRHLRHRADRSVETIRWPGRGRYGAVSRDGTLVAALAGTTDSRVRVWDVATTRPRFTIDLEDRGAVSLALAPDAHLLAIGFRDGGVELRRASDGAVVRAVRAHASHAIDIDFPPGGDRIAVASRDTTISIWDTATLRCLARLRGHRDRVICVRWDHTGRRLVSGGRGGDALLWDIESGTVLRTFRGHAASVEGVALNGRGRLATVSRDMTVRLWDVETGRALAVRRDHTSNVRAVAFTHDGTAFVSASWDRSLRVWDAATGDPLGTLRGHHGRVIGVAALPDGRIVSFSGQGAVKFWTVPDEEIVTVLHDDAPVAIAFDRDARRLVTIERLGALRVWDVRTGARLAAAETGQDMLRQVSTTPDGTAFVVAGRGGALEVRELAGARVRARFGDGTHAFCVHAASGRVLSAHADGHVEIHDLSGARLLRERWHDDAITRVAWSPDGTRIATSDARSVLRLVDAKTREPLAELRMRNGVADLAFAPDSRSLAVVAWNKVPELRRVPDLAPLQALRGHSGRTYAAAFIPDGTRIATAGADATVRLWDTATGEQTLVLRDHRFPVRAVAFSADGSHLASADGSPEDSLSATRIWSAAPR